MQSLKSRAFIFALKYRHLLRFQMKRRCNIDWDTPMTKLREETENAAGFFGKLPEDIEVSPAQIDNVYAEWIRPKQAPEDRVILYFHGGGYTIGSCSSHRQFVAKFAKGSCMSAIVFDYGLAPENPYPAALNDSLKVYNWLLDQGISPSRIAFIGDSAGGGLCLASLLAIRDRGLPLPAAAVAQSPWTDLTNSGESLITNVKRDALTWRESWTIFSKYYAGDNDPKLPYISPLFGELTGLPPLLIYVGGDELLRDDSTRFVQKAKEARVDVTLIVGNGMFHCYPVCSPMFPEAKQAMEHICEFVRKHTACTL